MSDFRSLPNPSPEVFADLVSFDPDAEIQNFGFGSLSSDEIKTLPADDYVARDDEEVFQIEASKFQEMTRFVAPSVGENAARYCRLFINPTHLAASAYCHHSYARWSGALAQPPQNIEDYRDFYVPFASLQQAAKACDVFVRCIRRGDELEITSGNFKRVIDLTLRTKPIRPADPIEISAGDAVATVSPLSIEQALAFVANFAQPTAQNDEPPIVWRSNEIVTFSHDAAVVARIAKVNDLAHLNVSLTIDQTKQLRAALPGFGFYGHIKLANDGKYLMLDGGSHFLALSIPAVAPPRIGALTFSGSDELLLGAESLRPRLAALTVFAEDDAVMTARASGPSKVNLKVANGDGEYTVTEVSGALRCASETAFKIPLGAFFKAMAYLETPSISVRRDGSRQNFAYEINVDSKDGEIERRLYFPLPQLPSTPRRPPAACASEDDAPVDQTSTDDAHI